jgi:hypothetical protein
MSARRWIDASTLAAALLFAVAGAALAQGAPHPVRGAGPLDGDLAFDFACDVGMRLEIPEDEQAGYAARLGVAFAEAGIRIESPQHALLVDRDPRIQAALLFRFTAEGGWRFTGAVPVSTGLPGRFEHFLTPLGVFAHTLENPDFRAEGTRNENGIRGYGRAGMRVFDFGWVAAPKGWGDHGTSVMRLQLHATDPDQLERFLGAPRSKGCIRVPAAFDVFLDRHGVLDADYEEALDQGRTFWVLDKDRATTRWPGRYLVVIESARAERPPWARMASAQARLLARPADCPPR